MACGRDDRGDEDRKARRTRYWGPERNARRRRKYAEDPEVRERHLARNRKAYRKGRTLTVRVTITEDPTRLSAAGRIRETGAGRRLSFTVGDLARALGLPYPQLVHRWRRQGQLPPPVVAVVGSRLRVYLEPEVRVIAGTLAAHFREVAYFRRDHRATRDRLAVELQHVRTALGIT